MEHILPTEIIEELQQEIGLQDRSAINVSFALDIEVIDYHGDEYLPAKFVVQDTYNNHCGDILIRKKDKGGYELMIPREDCEPEEYSDGLFWMSMYYNYVR